jgi:hypothetical protein
MEEDATMFSFSLQNLRNTQISPQKKWLLMVSSAWMPKVDFMTFEFCYKPKSLTMTYVAGNKNHIVATFS